MYIKRSKMPKTWPVARKSTKSRYIAVPSHSGSKGITLLFIIRDLLKIAMTRKEVRVIMLNGDVKVNNTVRKDDRFTVQVFDVVQFDKIKKNYKLVIVNRKFKLEEVSEKESHKKIVKIIGKILLAKGRVQMNLEDGQNFLAKESFSVGDSVVINTKEKKIEKVLPLKEGARVEIIVGKHAGETGMLRKIEQMDRKRIYSVKLKDKEVGLPAKTVLVIE